VLCCVVQCCVSHFVCFPLQIGASYGIDLDPVRGHLFLFRSEVERDTFLAHADKMKSWAPVEVRGSSLRVCADG